MPSSTTVKLLTTSLICISLSGCIIHVGGHGKDDFNLDGVSSVFGDLEVSEGNQVNNVSAVNGDIALADNVIADEVDTVNGDIALADNVTVTSAQTVNGDIQSGHNLKVTGSVETVNGDIKVVKGGLINGNIITVNGDITLKGVEVGLDVTTSNGDINLSQSTHIKGDIVFRRQEKSFFKSRDPKPVLYIAADVQLDGQIILERDVQLKLDNPQLQGKVVRRFGDE
jgi:DUF4097 and DUF4098 domain-containing protein YvlB